MTELMAALGLSQTALAKRVGVSQATIWKLANEPIQSSKHLHLIARELLTTPAYLMGETDDPSEGYVPAPTSQAVAAEMGLVAVRQVDLAIGMGSSYIDQEVSEAVRYFPREWLDLFTRTASEKLIVARGSGDSMVPTIFDNDLVLIDTSETMPRMTDQVWAVSYNGLGSVKRLRPTRDGGWLLMSDNPAISDITAYDGEMHVLGKVCAFFRKM